MIWIGNQKPKGSTMKQEKIEGGLLAVIVVILGCAVVWGTGCGPESAEFAEQGERTAQAPDSCWQPTLGPPANAMDCYGTADADAHDCVACALNHHMDQQECRAGFEGALRNCTRYGEPMEGKRQAQNFADGACANTDIDWICEIADDFAVEHAEGGCWQPTLGPPRDPASCLVQAVYDYQDCRQCAVSAGLDANQECRGPLQEAAYNCERYWPLPPDA